jgi:hypothetical protein
MHQMQPGRLQNTELVVPIIVGTVSQHLGKKVCCLLQQPSNLAEGSRERSPLPPC